MKKVDMHMHTSASDGTWDATELINELKKSKIDMFSVTDHDSIGNIKEIQETLKASDNLIFIPGTELSTEYEGKEYHLTLYNFDINNQDLLNLMNWTNQNKLNSNLEYISKYVANKHADINVEDFEKYEHNRKRGGWKSLNYMIDKDIHKDILEHLRDVGKSGLKAKLKDPEEVIKVAKKSGGKIFLAHPSYYYKNSVMPLEELKGWVELGIDGIECFSPYNGDRAKYYVDFSKKNNLMISGGSDCHGSFIPTRKLGVPNVSLDDLNIDGLI